MKLLEERDFVKAAFILECEIEAVKAVCEVEAPKGGFLKSGRPAILFEGHQFYKYTKGKFAESHPTLCHKDWTTKNYKGGEAEWERLEAAMKLDRTAALMSTSFGKFQIMGFNFALCGFTSVEAFYEAMQQTEWDHLNAFIQYIEQVGLKDELQERRWADFARKYNGPGYQKNQYDVKMAAAYKKFKALT